MTSRLDRFSKPHVDTLNGVGGVDDPAHLRRKHEERNDAVPGSSPGRGDQGMLLAPFALLEGFQCIQGRFRRCRRVDRFELSCNGFPILPSHEIGLVADQANDAGLHRSKWESRLDGFREAL